MRDKDKKARYKMDRPTIYLSVKAYQKMRVWTEMAKGEVSWLGTVSRIEEDFFIEDIYLLKQVCTDANTSLDDASVGEFLTEMAKEGNDPSKIKAWLHSHGRLKAFWSQTDEETIERMRSAGYLISVVTNKDGEMLGRIDIFNPFHVHISDTQVNVFHEPDEEFKKALSEEFHEKVTEQVPLPMPFVGRRFPGTTDTDRKIEELEEAVSLGKISLEEYQCRISELDLEPFWPHEEEW